ncbi:MAG: HD domain-containing protein [Candidatus Micrarchaeia archaeon]
MYVIKDSIHGGIRIAEEEKALIDSSEFQRLRRIRQLAVAYLVYPGANNTRFEHSLGTMHLTGMICEHLGLEKEENFLRIAALLHDIGHCAFSHEAERVLDKTHEEIMKVKIKETEIREILVENGYSAEDIIKLCMGRGFGSIISFGLGPDRMDYLLRDSHYTGVAYGIIDAERIIETMGFDDDLPYVDIAGLEAAESMLIARFMMFSTVYYHHTVRIASSMLRKGIGMALREGVIDENKLMGSGDEEIMHEMRMAGFEIVERLLNRDLYKRAYEISWSRIREKLGVREIKKLEREVVDYSGCEEEDVVVDVPYGYGDIGKIPVGTGNAKKDIKDVSDIVRSLDKAEEMRMTLIVATIKDRVDGVRKACEKLFGIKYAEFPYSKERRQRK